jgi:hypothetical protein
MQDRHARMLRAAVVSVIVMVLSAGAHLGGGGRLPPPGILLGLGALTMLSAIIVTKRTLRLPALVGVLGGGQFALHHAFGFFASAATTVVCASDSTHLGHSAALTCTVRSAEASPHASGGETGVAMFAAHAIATLATAILMARGEEALHSVAGWLRPLFTVPRVPSICPSVRAGVVFQVHRLHAVPFLISPRLRGPPSFR